jgi:hypothetical protein
MHEDFDIDNFYIIGMRLPNVRLPFNLKKRQNIDNIIWFHDNDSIYNRTYSEINEKNNDDVKKCETTDARIPSLARLCADVVFSGKVSDFRTRPEAFEIVLRELGLRFAS